MRMYNSESEREVVINFMAGTQVHPPTPPTLLGFIQHMLKQMPEVQSAKFYFENSLLIKKIFTEYSGCARLCRHGKSSTLGFAIALRRVIISPLKSKLTLYVPVSVNHPHSLST